MITFQAREKLESAGGVLRKVRDHWAVRVLGITRAATIGAAYIAVRGIPGLTSSFVAIFVALLAFDVMVAAPSLRPRQIDFKSLLSRTLQALAQTVASLSKGLSLGLVFGTLTLLGVSPILGSIFTVGLSYTWAQKARRSFTGFVAVLGGLAIFEQISAIQGANTFASIVAHVLPIAWRVSSGTVIALLSGWFFGIPIGIATRLVLARPYRLRNSNAYDQPYEVRPFEEVVHAGREFRISKLRVEPEAPIAGKSLAELGWRDAYQATIIAIERGSKSISLPRGSEQVQTGDVLLVLCPIQEFENLEWLAKPIVKGV